MTSNESRTRSTLIDPQLEAAGWRLNDRSLVRFEIPVDGYDAEPWNGVTDYCLYDPTGHVLAVVEAKRCSRSPREADEQLRHYVTEIAKRQPYAPFGFMANGRSTFFWEVGEANPRPVAGFFSPDDLVRLLFIDRETFRVFQCDGGAPTFLYEYAQAVKDGFLVDFSLYQAQTGFQRKGIKGADLTEEDRNALIEQGIDPDALDYAGTEIEVIVSNRDTLRKQWEEVMEVCLKDQSGQLPGKTIVFAMTKDHANRVREVFEEMYPQHVGLAVVITSGIEHVRDGSYGDGLTAQGIGVIQGSLGEKNPG